MIPLEIQPRPTRLYKEPASGKAVLEEQDQRRSFFSMQRDLKKKYMVGNSSKDKAVSIKKEARPELSPTEAKDYEYVGRTARDNG